jgi:hypothetical protein
MTNPTFTRAQECDTQTRNPLLASTIPSNTVLIPATLNEQFKQKMLVPPLSERLHHPSDSRMKWWRDSAFNIMASASITSSHLHGHHIIPMSDLKDPQFVELF